MRNGITSHVVARVGSSDGPFVRMTLLYRREQPWEVTARFGGDPADPAAESVPWVFARELLALGLLGPVGDGDVHVCPAGGRRVAVELDNGQDGISAYFSAHVLQSFLHATARLVPPGTESQHTDLDSVCDALRRAA